MSWVLEVGKYAQAWHAFERSDPQQGFGLGVRQHGKVVLGGTILGRFSRGCPPSADQWPPLRGGRLGTIANILTA